MTRVFHEAPTRSRVRPTYGRRVNVAEEIICRFLDVDAGDKLDPEDSILFHHIRLAYRFTGECSVKPATDFRLGARRV